MSGWQNEDDIKAQLRVMTDELRRLREGLRDLVIPQSRRDPTRAFIHRQSWPTAEVAHVAPDQNGRKPARRKHKAR